MICIQNIDYNKYRKWILVRYFNPANYHPARITKADKNFASKLCFKVIKFPFKIRDIHKIKKKNALALALLATNKKKDIQSMYQKKKKKKKKKKVFIYYL